MLLENAEYRHLEKSQYYKKPKKKVNPFKMLTYMHGWEFDQYCITTENIHSAYIKKSRNNYVPALVIFNIKQKERENFQFFVKICILSAK